MSALQSPLTTAGLPRSCDAIGVAVFGLAPDAKMSSTYRVTSVSWSADAANSACAPGGGGGGAATVTVRAADVVVAPPLSVAAAVSE